jgi:hypothetical protein
VMFGCAGAAAPAMHQNAATPPAMAVLPSLDLVMICPFDRILSGDGRRALRADRSGSPLRWNAPLREL